MGSLSIAGPKDLEEPSDSRMTQPSPGAPTISDSVPDGQINVSRISIVATSNADLEEVVRSAATGDQRAWAILTDRFSGMIMGIARRCRLSDVDAAEVQQTTWLRLVENIDRIEQPDRIGAWLATTSKRESLRLIRKGARCIFDSEAMVTLVDPDAPAIDAGPLADERAEVVQAACAQLPPCCRRLLDILGGADPPSYKEVSQALAMPIGSVGPTRGRCLDHLRRIILAMGVEI